MIIELNVAAASTNTSIVRYTPFSLCIGIVEGGIPFHGIPHPQIVQKDGMSTFNIKWPAVQNPRELEEKANEICLVKRKILCQKY